MRKRMRRIILSVCSCAMVAACVFASIDLFGFAMAGNQANTNGQNGVLWSAPDFEIKKEYSFGELFNVPNRTLTVDGVQAEAKSVLEYPNGATTLNKTVKLNESGNYKLRYTASVNGKAYLEEYEFFVIGAQVSTGSEKSSVSYGSYTYDVDRMALKNSQTGETERKEYSYTCQEGLMVRLARGDALTFHEIIDLSSATEMDSLIKVFATPDQQGQPDFEKLIFTFTDVYDPSITLKFISQHTQEGYDYRKTYSLVGGNGQKESGLDFMDPNKMYVGKWGTSGDGSYTRRFKSIYQNKEGVWVDDYKEQDAMPIDFRFDAATKTAYLRDYRNATRINKIADLDDPAHFDTIWKGFTDGKVRLSISADAYSADTANFCITSVMGLDLKETEYVDEEAPILQIENDYAVMPSAQVGGFYPVPKATAFDLNVGACEVKTSVWYNYTSKDANMLPIKEGKFKTEKYGDYAIVYEANDGNGNVAKEILWVRAEKELPEMQINFTADFQKSVLCGEWIEPVDYEVINACGKFSDVKISIKAVINGREINAEKGFRAEEAGEYKLVYTAADYIGRIAEAHYIINVEKGTEPRFVDEPKFPFTFISGKEYVMPVLYANDYTGESLKRELAYAELTDKKGTQQIKCGEKFVPVVAKQGDLVKVVYKYEYQDKIIESKEYTIPAILQKGKNEENKTRFFISNYLIGRGFTTETKKNGITVTATEADGNWTFANELVAEAFSVKLRGTVDESAFNGLNITLTDYQNVQQAVSIYAQNLADSIVFYVGEDYIKVNNTLNDGAGFEIGYSNGAIKIGTTEIRVKNYLSGEKFEGFSSERILLSVAFDGAEIGAKYAMEMLCGENTGTLSSDNSSPIIRVLGDYGGVKKIGESVQLPRAIAGDLLDPNVEFTVSITSPDSNIVSDENGKRLENVNPNIAYTLKLDQYGQYMITYKAVDSVGNENKWSYSIIVKDETAPTLTFEGKYKNEAKLGETLVLPKFIVKDNVTREENLIVTKFVYTPSGSLYQLPQTSNSIICSQIGTYEFRVIVIDEEGNMALYTHVVVVTK